MAPKSSLQTITLYSHTGPNPWKCAIVLEELGLPYKHEMLEMANMKQPPYNTEINPNGRVPAIKDPNTNLTLWESGAINMYLIEQYDADEGKLSYGPMAFPQKHLLNQWLHFQVSGQGPYFGQAAWFGRFHSEKLPSAVERYQKEIERVTGVLDTHLKNNGTGYLVGDKCTFADLAFVPWANSTGLWLGEERDQKMTKDFPHYAKWIKTLNERPAVKKVMADRAKAMEKK